MLNSPHSQPLLPLPPPPLPHRGAELRQARPQHAQSPQEAIARRTPQRWLRVAARRFEQHPSGIASHFVVACVGHLVTTRPGRGRAEANLAPLIPEMRARESPTQHAWTPLRACPPLPQASRLRLSAHHLADLPTSVARACGPRDLSVIRPRRASHLWRLRRPVPATWFAATVLPHCSPARRRCSRGHVDRRLSRPTRCQ